MFCPHCGKYVTGSKKDCDYCGRPLDTSTVSNVNPAPAAGQPAPQVVPQGTSVVYGNPYARKPRTGKKGQIFCSIIGAIGGFVSIILGLVVSGMSIGSWEMSNKYGADFYTDVQNATAQAANNVQDVADILNVGLSSLLIIFGVAMIGIFLTRFFIEFLKERQVDFEMGMALDMGQLLSLPFIIIGIFMIVRSLIRPEVVDINAVVAHANKEYAREDKKNKKR
jgi:hypothetical protein